ncbi:hypothetical protein BG000_000201 [Podila horticola]|nr:hypothetical protein BG000_000201 [Podila horticola]
MAIVPSHDAHPFSPSSSGSTPAMQAGTTPTQLPQNPDPQPRKVPGDAASTSAVATRSPQLIAHASDEAKVVQLSQEKRKGRQMLSFRDLESGHKFRAQRYDAPSPLMTSGVIHTVNGGSNAPIDATGSEDEGSLSDNDISGQSDSLTDDTDSESSDDPDSSDDDPDSSSEESEETDGAADDPYSSQSSSSMDELDLVAETDSENDEWFFDDN